MGRVLAHSKKHTGLHVNYRCISIYLLMDFLELSIMSEMKIHSLLKSWGEHDELVEMYRKSLHELLFR